MTEIILASKSKHRAELLRNAGIAFRTEVANIDEREVEKPMLHSELIGSDIAEVLAIAKATDVSQRFPDTMVIGCDQTLTLNNEMLHKPKDLEDARRRLLKLSGKTHDLNTAVALVSDGNVVWQYTEVCSIKFRDLDPGYIGRHLAEAGDAVLSSVGAYQIEGLGVNLFELIKGDFFSIMGLPLLPLLGELRKHGLIDG